MKVKKNKGQAKRGLKVTAVLKDIFSQSLNPCRVKNT